MSIFLMLVLNTATCMVPQLVPGAEPSALPNWEGESYEWATPSAVVGIAVLSASEMNGVLAIIANRVDAEGISKRIREARVVLAVNVEGRLTEEIGKTLERIAERCSGLIVADREIIDEGGRTVARIQ